VARHTRDAALGGVARDLGRYLKLALSDEQNELLTLVRGAHQPTAVALPDAAQAREAYLAVARRELRVAALAGWQAVAGEDLSGTAGPPGSAAPAAVPSVSADGERAAERAAGTAATMVVDELWLPLRQRVDESLARASDDPVDALRSLFRETRNQQVGALADYGSLAAYALGQQAAARRFGHGLRWDCHDCGPDCLDNSLAGPVAAGEAFPTGHVHPPAHRACRCLLVVDGARPGDSGSPPTPGQVHSGAV
jgi:hypothetical protein